jgi:ABC-type glycerol-3-phosphate transport system substrate-binding protein
MLYFNPPTIKGGKGDPTITSSGVETWIIPKLAKHPDEAADFYKLMTSLKMAKEFVVKKNTLMSIIGSDDVELPPDLIEPAKCMRQASNTWDREHADWYKAFGTATENALAALLIGEITPQHCVDRMEAAATKTRNDKSIPKHKME